MTACARSSKKGKGKGKGAFYRHAQPRNLKKQRSVLCSSRRTELCGLPEFGVGTSAMALGFPAFVPNHGSGQLWSANSKTSWSDL